MPAAEHVREVGDRVRAGDHALHRFGHVGRDRDRAVAADRLAARTGFQRCFCSCAALRSAACICFSSCLISASEARLRDDLFAGLRRRGCRLVVDGCRRRKAAGFLGVGRLGDVPACAGTRSGRARRAARGRRGRRRGGAVRASRRGARARGLRVRGCECAPPPRTSSTIAAAISSAASTAPISELRESLPAGGAGAPIWPVSVTAQG